MDSVLYISEDKQIQKNRIVTPALLGVVLFGAISLQLPLLAKAYTSPITAPISLPLTSVVLATPTPTPSQAPIQPPSNSGSNNGGSQNSGNSCNDQAPFAPRLFQIQTTANSASLYINPVGRVTGYTVFYGTKATKLQYVVTFSTDVKVSTVYTIKNLNPNTTYFFAVKAHNGCKTSGESNMLKATTTRRFARPRITTAWEQMRKVVLSWFR